jgi:ABC-2 type transport system ATP-binding protein
VQVFRITDGELRASDGGSVARIVLRGSGDVPWHASLVSQDGDRVELVVPADRADKVLLDALQRGWTVLAVAR